MTTAPEGATVLDTSVLSNFAHVGRLELLVSLPRAVTVPVVRAELEAGLGTHSYLDRALTELEGGIPVVDIASPARECQDRLLETLDPGEAQALAVAETTDGTLVSDDGDARSAARRRDVALTGSIGLLVRFVEAETLSRKAADDHLKRWIDEAGFRAPARDMEVFLET